MRRALRWPWLILAVGWVACRDVDPAPPPELALEAIGRWRDPAPMPQVPLVDQSGSPFVIPAGRWTLLSFVYAGCDRAEACPTTLRRFAEVASREDPRLDLVAVTLDPARDDPAAMAALGARHAVPVSERVRLATGDVRLLTEGLPALFNVVAVPEGGEIQHSVRTVLLRPDGTLAATFDDARFTVEAVFAAVNAPDSARGAR